MRIVIAQMKHETNTYLAGADAAGALRCRRRRAARRRASASRRARARARRSPPSSISPKRPAPRSCCRSPRNAWPSGPVEDAAFEHMRGASATPWPRAATRCCSTCTARWSRRAFDDGEGELLRRAARARARGADRRGARHARQPLSPPWSSNATVIAGYQTYPHVDIYDTGLRAGRAILAHARGPGAGRRWPGATGRCCRT